MKQLSGPEMIEAPKANPHAYFEEGLSVPLLKAYFKGLPLETLPPLLQHADPLVQSEAVWIVSELGAAAMGLIDDMIPFLKDERTSVRYEALESIMCLTEKANFDQFIHVLEGMDSELAAIRGLCIFLVSNANPEQIDAAFRTLSESGANLNPHTKCLELLRADSPVDSSTILDMLSRTNPIERKYGAILAKRTFNADPEPIMRAAASDDPDISNFARQFLDFGHNLSIE